MDLDFYYKSEDKYPLCIPFVFLMKGRVCRNKPRVRHKLSHEIPTKTL
jgi:hypothetical protein